MSNIRNTYPQKISSPPFKSTNVSQVKDEKKIMLRGSKLPDKTVSRVKDGNLSTAMPVKPKPVSRVKDGNLSTALPVKPKPVSRVKDGNPSTAMPVKPKPVSRVKDGNPSTAMPVKPKPLSRVKDGNLSTALPVKPKPVSRVKDGNLSTAMPVKPKPVSRVKDGNLSSNGVIATPNPVPIDVNITLYDPTLCESCPGLRWVFYVHSAPENCLKRDLIRVTWGNPVWHRPGTTRLVFMVGQTSDPKKQVCG